jgi:hypothetical protein
MPATLYPEESYSFLSEAESTSGVLIHTLKEMQKASSKDKTVLP